MSHRHQICAALFAFSTLAYAQESTPPAEGKPAEGESQAAILTLSGSAAAVPPEASGFLLPGGMGYTPLNFTPGQGSFDRPPVSWSTTLRQGYDDNIYSSHTNEKGSAITSLSQDVDILFMQSRFALSTQASVGGQYYWSRDTDKFSPIGSLNLVSGYKLSPRAQLSAVVNATYTNQTTNSPVNGVVQGRGEEYLLVNSKLDLLYRWSPRVSTNTTYAISGIYYKDAENGATDSTTQTIGQSVRYQFSRLVTGVLEARASHVAYNADGRDDPNLYYALTGADFTLSRRLTASARTGVTFRDQEGLGNSAMPYVEGNVNYALTRTSQISANLRYGYNDNGSTGSESTKSTRAGVAYSRSLTSHLRANLSLNGNFVEGSETSARQDTISGAAGLSYDVSKYLSAFASFNQVRTYSSDSWLEYTKNVYYIGASYSY